MPGTMPRDDQNAGHREQRSGRAQKLIQHLLAHVPGGRDAGDDDRRGGGEHQGRHLRHQTIADGEQDVVGRGVRQAHAVAHGADDQPADDVDEQDQDAGDGVAADELAGAVHGAVEVRLLGDLLPSGAGLLVGQKPGVQIGVDGHLLAGQGVQGEPRAHLGDPACAFRHHYEVDDHEDGEHHQANRVVAAHHEIAERLDHMPGGRGAGVAVQQYHPGGGDVQCQPHEGGQQQHGGEDAEFQRAAGVHRHQNDDQRQRDVEGEGQVQHHRRQRHHHHAEQDQHHQRRAEPGDDRRGSAEGLSAHRSPP